jgi:hypothetical protein
VANLGSSAASVVLKFLGNEKDGRSGDERSVSIGPLQSATFADVLNSQFGLASGFGAIRVRAGVPDVVVVSQTSTPTPDGGTFGQSVPAASKGDLLYSGSTCSIPAIREDASFRTNLIMTNATETPLEVDVSLVSDGGMALGAKRYALPPLGMKQITRVAKDLGVVSVSGGRLTVTGVTPGGSLAAYASVIDDSTNDPRTLLPTCPATGAAGPLDWILPSSAKVSGLGGSFYTTDLTVANLGATDTTFTIKFLGNNADGRAGVEKSFALGAGESVLYADLLQSVFGLTTGYGAARLRSATPALAVLAQTSTPSPTGGTFGQSVPAAGPQDLIGAAPRSIAAVREDSRFRTNLILANAGEAALDVTVSLVAATGESLGTKPYRLPPLGMTQVTRIVRDIGAASDVSGGRLVLSTATADGRFAAYASVIDNVTNDPRTLLPR